MYKSINEVRFHPFTSPSFSQANDDIVRFPPFVGVQDLEEEFSVPLRFSHHSCTRLAFTHLSMVTRQGNVRSPTLPSLRCLLADGIRDVCERSPADKDYTVHRMILATHTSGEDNNYLQIATVHLPKPQSELSLDKYDDERGGASLSYFLP